MPAFRPRLCGKETTSAPWARATCAVASVEPSSITSTSTSGSSARVSASTAGSDASSFHAGMNTSVRGIRAAYASRGGGHPGDIRAGTMAARPDLGDHAAMATADPQDGAQAPAKRRGPWIWLCVILAIVAAGLLIWALKSQSDLDTAQGQVSDLQSQADEGKAAAGDAVTAAKGAYDDLASELGTTSDDLANTEQELSDAEQAAEQAAQDAADAEQAVAKADNQTDKAKAEADQANAEVQAAESKAKVAASCAKAYVSAFGALFDGDSVEAQAPAVREQLQKITADCKTSFAGA